MLKAIIRTYPNSGTFPRTQELFVGGMVVQWAAL
uniref:Uncharacterized protein n=1 Tax=Anguilla anguilla TaxID=7936 RepID=A0A0E9VXP5_ANGAN